MTTISQTLRDSAETLSQVSDTPSLDAQTLLAYILGKSRAWVLGHPEDILSTSSLSSLNKDLDALLEGRPLPYVIGQWEFFGLDFTLTPDTLIPRPETEILVEQAINWLRSHPHRRFALDLGTGSGCIAVALATHVQDLSIIAGDISLQALKVARINSIQHGVSERIGCLQVDLIPPTWNKFDLICANLPYIPTSTLHNLKVFGKEPILALDGGDNGLEAISRLLKEAPRLIAPGGLILIEIEASQGVQVTAFSRLAFPQAEIIVLPDLSGHNRLVVIQVLDG